MIELLNSIKIEEIYKFNLTSEIEILEFLGLWDSLSEHEKYKYEDWYSKLNQTQETNSEMNESDEKFVYGEISKRGVKDLSKELQDFSGVFYDLGSGNGKMILHLSLISNFNKYIGVELSLPRYQYSLRINTFLKQENVNFINGDFLTIDFSDANFIFCNDSMMSSNIIESLIKKIPTGCYYTSFHKNRDEFIKTISLNVSWYDKKVNYNLYKKTNLL